MTINRTHIIIASVFFAIGALCGFFLGKSMYQPTYGEKVARDTVIVRDTVFDYQPAPVDSARVRYVTSFLPVVKNDTINHFVEVSKMIHDTVEVQVPITSKHYGSKDYDAWVSGYEPSLDSIKVYKETQYITETITKTVKDKGKHFFLDVGAGCEYQFNTKTAVPFAELGAMLKIGKVGIGAYGGYAHDIEGNKASPIVKAKVTYDIMCF
jgi:hypothetical protein